MKKISSMLMILSLLTFSLSSYSKVISKNKKVWKGKITYSITYEGENITPASVARAPKTIVTSIYGNKQSTQMVQGPMVITMIQDPEFNHYYQLFEMGEKKIAMKQDLSDFNADSLKKFDSQIDLINETKIIAGVECKKAIVTLTPRDSSEGEEMIFDVYYAPEIGDKDINKGSEFDGIPGMLLQFQSYNSGMIIKFVATEVKTGGVKDTDFMLPSDFKVVAPSEWEKEFSN